MWFGSSSAILVILPNIISGLSEFETPEPLQIWLPLIVRSASSMVSDKQKLRFVRIIDVAPFVESSFICIRGRERDRHCSGVTMTVNYGRKAFKPLHQDHIKPVWCI